MSAESEQERMERRQAFLDMVDAGNADEWEDYAELRKKAFIVDNKKGIVEPITSFSAYLGIFKTNTFGPYSFVIQDTIRDFRDVEHIRKTRKDIMNDEVLKDPEDLAIGLFPYIKSSN